MAGRGCITRHGDFAREQTGTAGKIESMDFQQASGGVEKREAGEVVMNDALEGGNDATENLADLAADHQNIVDLQKNAQAGALAGELRFFGPRNLENEGGVGGPGKLNGDAPPEFPLQGRLAP